jgi:hypothetical protein
VGILERHFYSSSSGKEEWLSKKSDNTLGFTMRGGGIVTESGRGPRLMGESIAIPTDRCLCGRKRKSLDISGGEQVAVTEQRGEVQNVYSRTVVVLTSQRDSCETRVDACRRVWRNSVNMVVVGYCELSKMLRMVKNVFLCDECCMCQIVLQNYIILRRLPCDGKKKRIVRDGSKYGLVIFGVSYHNYNVCKQ